MKLVLLPGMDGTGRLFAPLLERLSPRLEPVVIAFPPDEPLGYAELAERVRPRLPAAEPFVLLGESFSGPLAIMLAASAPCGLAGLALCCSFADNPRPRLRRLAPLIPFLPFARPPRVAVERLLSGRDSSRETSRAIADSVATVRPAVIRRRLVDVVATDTLDALSRVSVPCMSLRGRHDRMVPAQAAERMHAAQPALREVVLDGPHCMLLMRPAAVAAALERFVATLEARAAMPTR